MILRRYDNTETFRRNLRGENKDMTTDEIFSLDVINKIEHKSNDAERIVFDNTKWYRENCVHKSNDAEGIVCALVVK